MAENMQPESRAEQYLNRMAFASGEIPEQPECRMEAYLDAIVDRMEATSLIGKFLSTWKCSTGLPGTNPSTLPYTYVTGDYFIIKDISDTKNYKPSGSKYTGTASTVEETNEVEMFDMYFYDGTQWELLKFGEIFKDAVKSVNGKTGAVILAALDISTTEGVTVEEALQNIIDDSAELRSRTSTIEGKLPAQASSSNQVADKNFVNSSIATNAAYYISNSGQPFTSVAELEAYSGTVTNNDYAFVTGIDSEGNTFFDRYKATVNGASVTWDKEYRLNNSSFTAVQWAAIESGITASAVAQIADNASEIEALKTDKVEKAQGTANADKVLCTNGAGVVFPLIPTSELMRMSNFTVDENGRVWFGAHTTRIHNFYSPYDQRPGIKYSFNFSVIINGQSGDYGGSDGISNRTTDPNTNITVTLSWMGWEDGYINKIGYVLDKGTSNQKIVWKILNPPVTRDEGIKAQAGDLAVGFSYIIPASELPKGTHDLSFCALVNNETYEIGTRTAQYGGGCFSITITNT